MKYGLRGWLGACAMILALRAMALLLRSERLGVGRPMILDALCVMRMSLFLLETVNML